MLGTLLLLTACAGPDPAPHAGPSGDVSAADAAFVRGMLAYHRHNLAVLELAASRAADREVKTVAAQTASLQRLQQTTMVTLLVGRTQLTTIPDAEPDTHVTQLSTLAGAAFDRGLIATLISHNEYAVSVARKALTAPVSDRTREVATSVDAGLSAENAALRQILTRLEASTGAPS
jgi:uncharacterized protein (DUF305 family)